MQYLAFFLLLKNFIFFQILEIYNNFVFNFIVFYGSKLYFFKFGYLISVFCLWMIKCLKNKFVFVFRMRYECKKHSKNKYILTLTIKEQINQIFSEEKKIKQIFFGNSEIFVNLEHSISNAGDDHHWYIYLIFRFKHMKFMSSEKILSFFLIGLHHSGAKPGGRWSLQM